MLVLFSFHNLLVAFCLLLADLVLAYQPKKKVPIHENNTSGLPT